MSTAARILCIFAGTLALSSPLAVQADWPERPVRLVAPFAPGGANDLMGRAAAEGVAKRLKHPVIVENKPGAGGALGADYVAKSKPGGDPYLVGAAGLISNSLIRKDLPYAESDFV